MAKAIGNTQTYKSGSGNRALTLKTEVSLIIVLLDVPRRLPRCPIIMAVLQLSMNSSMLPKTPTSERQRAYSRFACLFSTVRPFNHASPYGDGEAFIPRGVIGVDRGINNYTIANPKREQQLIGKQALREWCSSCNKKHDCLSTSTRCRKSDGKVSCG